MRPYELMLIFEAEIEDIKATAEEMAEVVRGLGAEVEKIDVWGKRRLAYPIKKRHEGVYVLYVFKISPDQIKELDRLLSLKATVLRHLVICMDAGE